jgi:hypothetical protein
MVSAIKSMEVIMGMHPLNLFDTVATPMYDAFTAKPLNSKPFTAKPATYPLLEENPNQPTSAAARAESHYNTTIPDQVSQRLLDRVLWKSVHGAHSAPPPAGPNAEDEGVEK